MKTVAECLESIRKRADAIVRSRDSEQVNVLQSMLRDLDAAGREEIQEKMFRPAREIARKLQQGQSLTAQDEKDMKLLIIGDAENYLKVENNFDEWMTEIHRLISDFVRVPGENLSIDQLSRLRAQVRDALNLLVSIVFYLQAKERVEKFRQAIHGNLESEDRMMLASMIITALESERQ
jgi:hypothetical protein